MGGGGERGELAGWQSPVSIVKSFIILPLGEKKPISIPLNLKFNCGEPVESRLKLSALINWSVGQFFLHFKGTPSYDKEKTVLRR